MLSNLALAKPTYKKIPLLLVGFFIAISFVGDVTKIKNLSVILMAITVIYFLYKDFKETIRALKNTLFYSICLFTVAMLYSVAISIEPVLSFESMNRPVLNSLLLFSFLIPTVLHKNSSNDIAKMIFISVTIGLFIVFARDLYLYLQNYKNGISPFTEMSHRDFSDSYIFCFPIILCLWHLYKKNSLLHWACFLTVSVITVILMLGTFARGAWLSALIMGLIIIVVNKEKLLAFLCCAFIVSSAVLLAFNDNGQDHLLTRKIEQTSSSNRYSGGTQGTALELILQNPIKGYGYGNDLYHHVYNGQVQQHPHWFYKESLGPHNVFLAIWFAAGIFGLCAAILMSVTAIQYSLVAYTESKKNTLVAQAILFLIVSFIGWFIVRGNVENVYINVLGIYFGLLMALGSRVKEEKKTTL